MGTSARGGTVTPPRKRKIVTNPSRQAKGLAAGGLHVTSWPLVTEVPPRRPPARAPDAAPLGQHARGVVSFPLRTSRGRAYDTQHRTAAIVGRTRRRGGRVAARGARAAIWHNAAHWLPSRLRKNSF